VPEFWRLPLRQKAACSVRNDGRTMPEERRMI
jgi:hypothetical protein